MSDNPVTVLFWYWRYGSLNMSECESVAEAVRRLEGDEDMFPDCIEVVENGTSRVLTEDQINEVRSAVIAECVAATKAQPRWLATSEIEHPNGEGIATYEWYSDRADAERDLASLRETFGDRVTLREIR